MDERRLVRERFPDVREIRSIDPRKGSARTYALMREGVSAIYHGWLCMDDWQVRPDLLLRQPGSSVFGDWHYVPRSMRRGHELKKEYLFPLMADAMVLEKIQGKFPREPGIINMDDQRLSFDASAYVEEWAKIHQALRSIVTGDIPEPVYRKSCEDTSPWGKACFRLAAERHDIALLFNVDLKKLHGLRSLGIRTVEDAASMDPIQQEGQVPGLTLRALQAVQRQAVSLRDQSVIIREPFRHETEGCEIHFDIESYPPTDTDYLYGFWMMDEQGGRYHAIVAEMPEQEHRLWKELLAWIAELPATYTVYHYANYEPNRLQTLAARYGDEQNPWLDRFLSRMVDLKEATREHAVFPLYFYSLKKICQFLGFTWGGKIQDGGKSVMVYQRWLETRRRAVFTSLRRYNQGDVEATTFLLAWLKCYATQMEVYAQPYPWQKKT